MKPERAVFFDLDGTLLDGSLYQESIVRACQKIAAAWSGLHAERLVQANRKVWEDYWPEINDRWMLGTLDDTTVRLEAWRRTLQACGCDDEATVRLALQTHREIEGRVHRLFYDVRKLFTTLAGGRVPAALITNGASDTQRGKLQALGIEHWFDEVIISGEVGAAKPDASVFRLALDSLGVRREFVWHVGDDLSTDIAGAKAAGVAAVWLNRRGLVRGQHDPEPDHEIASLADLGVLMEATKFP